MRQRLTSDDETGNKPKDMKKDYKKHVLKTATKIEEKTEKDNQEFFETEQNINKVDFEATKDKEIKDIVEQ